MAKNFSSMAKKVWDLTINPASIATTVVSVQTFACPGATLDMFAVVQPDTQEFADVRITSARFSAKDVLELTFHNFGVATRDQAAFTIKVMGL
jgi:hypothetical protein